MKQVPDRKKLRREYLRRKSKAYTYGLFGLCLFAPVAYFLLGAVLPALFRGNEAAFVCGMVLVMVLTLRTSFWLVDRSIRQLQQASRIPYVPPVTPATLPADEILVRGAEEPPVAQSEVLLRAAKDGQETPQEELLRVSQGEQQ